MPVLISETTRSAPVPAPRRGALARAGAACAVVAALVSGCSSSSLPQLSGFAQVRDLSARTEAAAELRARALSTAAVTCTSCQQALGSLADESATRLAALGGLWDPWGGQPPEGAEEPAPVSDAPVDVEGFVAWLAATAERDLAAAADPTTTESGDDARTLAAIALGRYRSAQSLASAYGISVTTGAARAESANQRLNGLGEAGVQTWGVQDFHTSPLPALPFGRADQGLAASPVLSAAVASWDCVAQTLPRNRVSGEPLADADERAEELMVRADQALSAGVADARTVRCSLPSSSPADLAMDLVAADVSLLASDSASVRAVGVNTALTDITRWGSVATFGAVIGVQ